MDAHRLQAFGMSAEAQQLQPGSDLVMTLVEIDALVIHPADDIDDIFHGVRMTQRIESHMATAGIVQLALLQVQPGLGQLAHVAGMVVVQVRDDHVPHCRRRDAQYGQRVDRAAQERPPLAFAASALNPVSTSTTRSPLRINQT